MTTSWPQVRLGDVLILQRRWICPDPEASYVEIGVRSFGRGIFHKSPVTGLALGDKRVLRIEPGDLVLMNVFAWEGAVAVAGAADKGTIGSHRFVTMTARDGRVEPCFLEHYFQTEGGRALLSRVSPGSAGRNRTMSIDGFLNESVPLPPVAEQRRISAHLTEAAQRVLQAQQLAALADTEADMCYARIRDAIYRDLDCERRPISEALELLNGRAFRPDEWGTEGRRIIRIQNLKYPDAPFNWYEGPVQSKHLVRSGDVLFAWSGQIVSLGAHVWAGDEAVLNQHIFRVVPRFEARPRFVQEGLNALVNEMAAQVRGLEMFHIRKQELDRLLFPVPSADVQTRIVDQLDAYRDLCSRVRSEQAARSSRLRSLMPSVLNLAFYRAS
jgi:type I restriction enzyme, S subunit